MEEDYAHALAGPRDPAEIHVGDQWHAAMRQWMTELDAESRDCWRDALAIVAEVRDDLRADRFNLDEWYNRAAGWTPDVYGNMIHDLCFLYSARGIDALGASQMLYSSNARCLAALVYAMHYDNRERAPLPRELAERLEVTCVPCRIGAARLLALSLSIIGIDNARLYPLAGLPREHVWLR